MDEFEDTNDLLELDDLVDNPTARVPVSLCLDCSGSMTGQPIAELNEGVRMFYNAINEDEIARYSAEISIVTFGPVQKAADFQTLDQRPDPPVLSADNLTPMGEAVKLALDLLDQRKEEYKKNGVDYHQPWLVLMTDGKPNGNPRILEEQFERASSLVQSRKLVIFPIGIGSDADMNVLERFSPNRSPLRLQGLNFSDFFVWLSQSISKVSQSTIGDDNFSLDLEGIKTWANLY